MNVKMNNVAKEHVEIILRAVNVCKKLAVGEPLIIDFGIGLCNINKEKFVEATEHFNKVFYKTNNIPQIKNTSKEKVKIINSLNDKVKEGLFEITEEETDMLLYALENYVRVGIGQFNYIDFLMSYLGFKFDDPNEKDIALKKLKGVYFPNFEYSASYGIYSDKVSENAKIAWDIYQIIRYGLDLHTNIDNFKIRIPIKASINTYFVVATVYGGIECE